MSRICQVTGAGPMSGNNVSHSNRKTRRRFLPNVHWHRIYSPLRKGFVSLFVSNRGLRTIDKKGIDIVLAELVAKGEKF